MDDLFGSLGVGLITFLIATLCLTWRFLWKGLLDRMDKLDRKLDDFIQAVYERDSKYVTMEYMEKDIKPWIRELEGRVRGIG